MRPIINSMGGLGSDAHCQAGAQRLAMARIADWLERNF